MYRKPRIKVVKRSSVSTGQLKRLLALHRQPINLVVFQGALEQLLYETLSWDWLRAYMLSALIHTVRSYPALPRARQQEHQSYVPQNPLVLTRNSPKFRPPTTHRNKHVP